MTRILIFLLLLVFVPFSVVYAEEVTISKDTLWAGEVTLSGDVLVLAGSTLTIEPGTVVTVVPDDSTRTEPQFISSYIEITVRGTLKAEGTKAMPITFVRDGQGQGQGQGREWAGVIVDEGSASISWCQISGADSGLTVINGEVVVSDTLFKGNRYGVSILNKQPKVVMQRTVFERNDYGMVLLNGATVQHSESRFIDSDQKDILDSGSLGYQIEEKLYAAVEKDKDAPYQSESLLGTVVWKDRVTVNGVVRIPPKSRLIIMPGTIVEFSKLDTNGDGIGENGLLVMGMLIAKGTSEQPIIFRSAEKDPHMADWDAVNIYTSDGFQNILEYVQVENSYRALHIHFSNVLVSNSVLRGNYRGMQFQESVVEVRKTQIYGNKNAMRARDSELSMTHNQVYNNYSGPNLFRLTGNVTDNIFAGNYYDGLRVREGALDVENNGMYGNRYGLTVAYANFGTFGSNVVMHNHEAGIILKGTDNIKVGANFVQKNGGNGISLLDSRAIIAGNQISANGERGIGIISFSGTIERNNIIDNALYAMGLDGENDIHAPDNWWGVADVESIIFDRNDDKNLGRVDYETPLERPEPFSWPLANVPVDTIWDGLIHLSRQVDTQMGSTLKIQPGTTVQFGKGVSLWLYGQFEAVGTPEKRILFTADQKTDEQSYWDQITTEKNSAVLKYCDFQNANMALHSHFSNVEVDNCRFNNNESGFRARGGPISVTQSYFTKNVYGMVFYLAKGVVEKNIFTNNEMGVLVRAERRGGMIVRHNNIFGNTRFNMRMGDFNEGNNVNAVNNFWGAIDPSSMIWDDKNEAGIGVVEYEPFANVPFELKIKN